MTRWGRLLAATLLGYGAVAAPAAHAVGTTLAIPVAATAPPLDPSAPADAWSGAARVALPWDVQHQRVASEPAEARIEQDGRDIYVRFDVQQRETLLAQQRTNDVGDGNDDEVWIDLWPNGNNGFYYQFAANSLGTRWQYSSENTAYSPTWQSFGAARPGGYVVTMKIPISIMRGSAGGGWKAQFVRIIRSTGERQIWSYGPAQTNGDDVTYAGSLSGLARAVAQRPRPRFAPYALGAAGAQRVYTTSRTGFDASVPITATSSIYGTVHPDFSNVEVDQQTIAPTAFARSFSEVRPFFTQAFVDPFSCDVCTGVRQMYTPSIPTPRDGYAIEGREGQIRYGAFDAVGTGRNDGALTMRYTTKDALWDFNAQTVAANQLGLADHTDTVGAHYNDRAHIDAYVNYGRDHGTNVLDATQAQRIDGGGFYSTNAFGIGGSMRKIGAYYNPVDGYVQHADIAGYALFENRLWQYGEKSPINSMQLWTFLDRYHGQTGGLNQTDNDIGFDLLTRSRIDVQANVGSSYLRLNSGVFTPISQNGVSVMWHSGTANNVGNNGYHGSSSTPTMIGYNRGRFGPGLLESWTRSSTMVAGPRGTLTLEADDTRQRVDTTNASNVQWLEKLSYTYAAGPQSSFAVGVRRLIGTPPLLDVTAPPGRISAYNLSVAYHRRLPHDELYVAYGDASQLSTLPQVLVKLIHYFGAEKGT